ncbi:MAG: hypothetical protein V1678_00590 [Candidatus Aenigmatarchaeota archaeon]
MNSSRIFYNNKSEVDVQSFFHQVSPILNSSSVSPSSSQWMSTFSFSTNVTDDDDTVNVSLWVRCVGGNVTPNGCYASSTFALVNTSNVSDYMNQRLTLTKQYSDGSDIGNYEWFFNATDSHGGANNTSMLTFNVTKRNVYFVYEAGNQSNVSRIDSNSTSIQVKLYKMGVQGAADEEFSGVSVKFWVTLNGTAWTDDDENPGVMQNTTGQPGDVAGSVRWNFNPTCPSPFFKTGQQAWNATFSGNTEPYIYYYSNSSSNYILFINSTLMTNLLHPNGNYYPTGTNVLTFGNVSDECEAVTGATTTFTVQGQGVSCQNTTGSAGNYSCTLATSSLGLGDYNETVNVTKQYYYDASDYKTSAFHLRYKPSLSEQNISPESEGWGYNFTMSVKAQDSDSGDYLNISLWKSVGGGNWINIGTRNCDPGICTSEQTFNLYPQFACNDYLNGPVNFKFNVTDSFGLITESSNFSANFQKDNVTFTIVQGSSAQLNRSDASSGNSFDFKMIVNDTDRNNVTVNSSEEPDSTINGSIWFTTEPFGPSYDSGISNTTDASGMLMANFNPDCSYKASAQYWKAGIYNSSCYYDTNMSAASTFNLKGQLKTNLYEPLHYSEFNVTDNVTFRWNVYTDCYGQGKEDDGNISIDLNTINLYNLENTSSCTNVLDEPSSGNYNCTWNSTDMSQGNWTVGINSEKSNYNINITNYTNWFYLRNRQPLQVGPQVAPEQGGWGSSFVYNISINDPENNTVTCSLYTNTTGSFVYRGSNTISTPGNCSITVNNFGCADEGNASFYFVVNDTYNTINTSETLGVTIGPNITRNNVTVTRISPSDGTIVNRSGVNYLAFTVRVNDTTRASVQQNVNVSFWVTNDSSAYNQTFNTTNSTGYATFFIEPDCGFALGNQYWKAGTYDSCYDYVNATDSNFTYNVKGSVSLLITQPRGEKFLRGNYPDGVNVTIKGNATPDCSADLSGSTVYFTSTQGSTNYACSGVFNESNQFNCTINTSSYSAKGWNVTMNISNSNYNSNSTTDVFSVWSKGFWIETKPVLSTDFNFTHYNSTGPDDGGWGETWTFRVNATDEDEDTLRLRMYFNRSDTGIWAQPVSGEGNMTNSTVKGTNVTVTFVVKLPGPSYLGGLSPVGPHVFKFNVTEVKDVYDNATQDFSQNINQTSNGTFTYLEDDVIFEHVAGNNTSVNRTGSNLQPLTVRVYDTDKGDYPAFDSGDTKIWVTKNFVSNYAEIPGTTDIQNGGYINTSATQFNPDCTFRIGPQKWKAGILDSNVHFKAKNSSEFYINVVTIPLFFNYTYPKSGKLFIKTPAPADGILLIGNVSDECSGGVNESTPMFVMYRGATVKDCSDFGDIIDYNNGTYACNITNQTLYTDAELTYGYWNVSFNATKSYYNSSASLLEQNALYIASRPVVASDQSYMSTGNLTTGWGDLWFYEVDVSDSDYSAEQGSLVNVSFWVNRTGQWEYYGSKTCSPPCTGIGIDALKFNTSFDCSDIRTNYYKFNATDNFYASDSRFSAETSSTDFSVTSDTATMTVLQGSGDSVNRDGIDQEQFQVKITDWSKGGRTVTDEGINGTLYITKNRTTFDASSPLTTGVDGYFTYDFDPNCSYYAGKQWWKVELNDTCFSTIQTTNQTVNVTGQLYNNLTYPAEGWVNGTGTSVPITMDVLSDCSGYIDEETPGINNSLLDVSYPIRLRRPNNVDIDSCSPWDDSSNGTYNCTYNTSSRPPGYYDIILSSAKQGFNSNTTYYDDWFELINTPPKHSNIQVTPSVGRWGERYNYSVDVLDTDFDSVNCTLYVSTDDGASWRFVGNMTIAGGSGTCSFTMKEPYYCNSTYYDIGTDNWFRFNLTDQVGQTNTSSNRGPNVTKDNIDITYVSGNSTNITRASGSLAMKVYVIDLTRNSSVGSNQTAHAKVSFNVTLNGADYTFIGTNQTNTSLPGNVTWSLDPNCTFDVGIQKWFAYYNSTAISNPEGCYEYNQTGEQTIGIVGQLVNYIVSPNTTNNRFVRDEENITWRGNVTTDCPSKDAGINNSNVSWLAIHSNGPFYCDGNLVNEGNGYYNCLFINNASKPTRNYRLNMSSVNVSWYNPTWTEATGLCSPYPCGFYVVSKPSLSSPSSSYTQDGGWGEGWTFSVFLTDADSDYNNVSLWIRNTSVPLTSGCPEAGAWPGFYLKSSQSITPGDINFNFASPNAISPLCAGTNFTYFFNTTDGQNSANTSLLNFTVNKDDINITLISGNESTLNRSLAPGQENVTFSVKVYDMDRNVLLGYGTLGTGKFYVTTIPTDSNSFVLEKSYGNIGESGFLNHTFMESENRCNYMIGLQRWRAEFGSTSNIYKATNSSDAYGDFYVNMTTYPLQVNVNRPNNESFRNGIDSITYIGNVSDDCGGITGASVNFNANPVEYSPTSECSPGDVTDYANGTYSCTRSPIDWTMSYHNLTMNATKSYYSSSSNVQRTNSFVITTNPSVVAVTPSSRCLSSECQPGDSNYGWGETWNFSAVVQDFDQGAFGYEAMNISLWIDLGSGYQLVNSTTCPGPWLTGCASPKTVSFMQTFNCQNRGARAYKINVSDHWNYSNSSTTGNIQINPDSVEVYLASSPTKIDRDVGSTSGTFVMTVRDLDRNQTMPQDRNASIFITKDGSLLSFKTDMKTNATGQINYTLNPDCTYSVGVQNWDGGIYDDECYYSENYTQSATSPSPVPFNISGQIKLNISNPTYQQVFNVTDNILIKFNTSSDCPADGLIVNATSPTSLVELMSPTGVWENCSSVNNSYDGWYNCTWNSTSKKAGIWSLNLTAGKTPNYNSNETMYQSWFQLVNWNITNTSISSVNPTTGGWTRLYNYTIAVHDQEGDSINCSLFVSTDNQGSWQYKGSYFIAATPGIPTTGTCYVTVHNFNCSDIDSGSNQKWFKWEMRDDDEANNTYNTSAVQGPTISESQVNIILVSGNNSYVNRSSGSNQIDRLAVNVFDSENSSYINNVNVSFWVTNNSADYRFDAKNQTDYLGNASYYLNPDCSYITGQQYWVAGVTDSCYEDKNSTTNFTLVNIGDMRMTITAPNGEKYLRGESSIILVSNISDECSNAISGATVNLTAIHQDSSTEHACSPITDNSNGTYNCTILNTSHSGWSAKGYNVKFNATATNYNYNTTTQTCQPGTSTQWCTDNYKGFWLETRPYLTSPSVQSSGDGGWGETWTFRINSTDYDYDNLRVRLYIRKCDNSDCNSPGAWQTAGTNSTVSGVNTMVTFSYSGFGEDSVGKWQYKFNVTDWDITDGGWDYNESSINNFTLQPDDINITYVSGNNSVVNRSIAPGQSNTTLSVRIYDTDRNVMLINGADGSGKFYVTTSPYNTNSFLVDKAGVAIVGDPGFLNNTFPNTLISSKACNYSIGPLRWRVEYGGSAYKSVNSSTWYNDFNVNLTTYPLQANILGPNNQTFRKGSESVPYIGNLTDDCSDTLGYGVSGASITFQGYSGISYPSWALCQDSSVTDNSNGTYNCSVPTSSASYSRYNLTMNATKQYYNSSSTMNKTDSFWIVSNPQIYGESFTTSDQSSLNPNSWGAVWLFNATVANPGMSGYTTSEYMNVSLWLNLTGQWQLINSTLCLGTDSDCITGKTISFVQRFNCGDRGNHQYKFNVSSYWNYTNTTSSHNFDIVKDDVIIPTGVTNPSDINRESGSGRFIFRINDTDANSFVANASTNAGVYFSYGSDSNYNISYVVHPNSTGYVNYDLDPDCNYSTGNHYWKAGTIDDECYYAVNLTSNPLFNVTGQLRNNLTLPVYNSIFNVTEQIPVNFTTLSDCSISRPDENPLINATDYKIELSLDGSSWETCSSANSYAGWYNCTWNSTAKVEGLWDVRVNSTKSGYFYTNSTVYSDRFQLVNWNASNTSIPMVTPTTGGWTRLYNYTIAVHDQEGDSINCSLFVSTDNQGSWQYKGSYIISGTPGIPTTGTCYVTVHNFNCSDIDSGSNQKWFKWTLVNGNPNHAWNTSSFQGPVLNESNVTITVVEGSGYEFNRSSGLNQVRGLAVNIYDSENLSYASGTNVSFWITNDSSAYRLEKINSTNTIGNSSYYFDPNCSHSVGQQYWFAGVTDVCYRDINTSTNFTVTLIGDFNNNISQPTGEEFLRGSNITLRGNVTDECQININQSTVNFTTKSNDTGQEFICSPVVTESSGYYYNCTFNTSSPTVMSARWYNVTMRTNKTNYNDQMITKYQGFWIETTPVLAGSVAIPSGDGGWGENWAFRVNLTDEDLDNNWVNLWIGTSSSSPRLTNQSASGINTRVEFNLSSAFDENDYNSNTTASFKFNATDNPPLGNSEDHADTNWQTTQLNPDNVSISTLEPTNVAFNRSSQKNHYINFTSQIVDTDKNQPLPAGRTGKFFYTKNGTNYTDSGFKWTVDDGYITQNVSLDCTFTVGPQYWIAGTANQTSTYAWETKNSSIANFTIITENLTINITAPINNTPWNSPKKSVDNITLYANVTDDCGAVRGATLTFHVYDQNCGGGVCDCTSVTDYNNGTYSCTILSSQTSTWRNGWHNVSVNVSKQYYNVSSDFQQNSFYLATTPDITPASFPAILATSTSGDGGWGERWKFEAWIVDFDGDLVNVSLYLNLSGSWVLRNSTVLTLSTPSNVTFLNNFNCGDIGNVKGYKFVATDAWNYTDQENSTFNILKDDTTVVYVSGSGEQADREGNDSTLVKVRIYDSDRSNTLVGSNRNGSLYVTTVSLGSSGNISTYILNSVNSTDSDSILTFDYNPNCSYGVGIQNWKAGIEGDVCYKDYQPESGFNNNITGQLKVNLTTPLQGSQVIVGDIVNVNSSAYSDCPNEGFINSSDVIIEALSPTSQYENITPVTNQNNGFYNSSWNTSFHKGGNWGIRVTSSKTDYYTNSTLYSEWIFLNNTPPTYSNSSVDPSTYGWGGHFNFSIGINDTQYDNVTCTLFTTTDDNSTWINRGNNTLYGGHGICSINITDFNCLDIGFDNYFLWQIDDGTTVLNSSAVQGPNITQDSVVIYYVSGQ